MGDEGEEEEAKKRPRRMRMMERTKKRPRRMRRRKVRFSTLGLRQHPLLRVQSQFAACMEQEGGQLEECT